MSDQPLESALRHYADGDMQQAHASALEVLNVDPKNAQALHLMGLIELARGQAETALDYLRRSVEADPGNAEFHNNLGVVLRASALHEEAEGHFRAASGLDPENATAAYNLGTSLLSREQFDDAEKCFRQAIASDGEYADPHCQLGDVLARRGGIKEAMPWWRKAIELDPNHGAAHLFIGYALSSMGHGGDAAPFLARAVELNPRDARPHWLLGNVLQLQQWYEPAIEHFKKAIAFDPECGQAYQGLCQSLAARGRSAEAIEAGRRGIQLEPNSVDAHNAMAIAFERAGRKNEAAVCYRTAARLQPDVQRWKYNVAAFSESKDAPPAAPADYLTGLFGEYAASFDNHLVGELKYRVPEQLLAAVRSVLDAGSADSAGPLDVRSRGQFALDILDLGCGTGLVGQLFKPLARSLVGVDLVPQMIQRARERNIYDSLHEAEINSFLANSADAVDLILAADVFIYIGDLSSIFPQVSRILRPGGLFAFSIESQEEPGYRLRMSRRYTHSVEYVRELARTCGLTEASVQEQALRQEDGKDVAGWVVVLRKPDGV
jgi:predicted TPR repeat methyltransferase